MRLFSLGPRWRIDTIVLFDLDGRFLPGLVVGWFVKLRLVFIDGLYLRGDDRLLLGAVERTVDGDDDDVDSILK